MKNQILVHLSALFFSYAAFADSTKGFTCPDFYSVEDFESAKKMSNQALQGDRVWVQRMSGENVVFQKDHKDLEFSPVRSTYYDANHGTGTESIFRVGYDMPARQCRRQIIFDSYALIPAADSGTGRDEEDKASLKGYLAVDVCHPVAQQVFALAKSKGAKTINDVFTIGNAGVAELKAASKTTEADNLSNVMDQLQKNLGLKGKQGQVVTYFTDDNGFILPRFKVSLTNAFFSEMSDGCMFTATLDERVDYYAEIIGKYELFKPNNQSLDATVQSYDKDGKIVNTTYSSK